MNELQTQYENDLQELNEKNKELRRFQRKRMTGYIVDIKGLQTQINSLKQKINNDKLLIKDKIKEKREPKYELSLLQKQRILENKKLKHIAKINKLTTTLNAIEKLLTGEEEVSVPKIKVMKEQKEKVKQLSKQIKSHPVSIEKSVKRYYKKEMKKTKELANLRENMYANLKFETISIKSAYNKNVEEFYCRRVIEHEEIKSIIEKLNDKINKTKVIKQLPYKNFLYINS